MCSELVTLFERLNSFKPSVAFHIDPQSFYFLYKSNDWFLCEMRFILRNYVKRETINQVFQFLTLNVSLVACFLCLFICKINLLTHVMPILPFCTPGNIKNLWFSGIIEKLLWPEMQEFNNTK